MNQWKWKVKSLSRVWLFATLWTIDYQAPPSMGFSRQEYWSGLPFPSPGDLPDPGTEPGSSALQADALLSEPPGKPMRYIFFFFFNYFFFFLLYNIVLVLPYINMHPPWVYMMTQRDGMGGEVGGGSGWGISYYNTWDSNRKTVTNKINWQ